ncbi:MAG: NAD(P)-dependent glycerol-3-phosphate dehydrogenase [Zetaproteobacteria bacterium]|nr:NAD(P)-dependent glycerol-3-phosphate dehydrogenase [Zetaproteobacteria bacterium]
MKALPVCVIGAGSWGTALAMVLAAQGRAVRLLARSEDQAQAMQHARCNTRYLPESSFPDSLTVMHDFTQATAGVAAVVLAVPSHAATPFLLQLAPLNMPVIAAFKGFQHEGGDSAEALLRRHLGDGRSLILSGPSFAKEVAQGLPTAMTLAATDLSLAKAIAELFHHGHFRIYVSNDMVGVAMGGSLKNIIAIAAGVAEGLHLGHNAMAALVTRGMVEISRLAYCFGARSETLNGLSGLGDLVLTCTGSLSRNRKMGMALAHGMSVDAARQHVGQVVEGEMAAHIALSLARAHQIEMPITEAVCRLLIGELTAKEAVGILLERPSATELVD